MSVYPRLYFSIAVCDDEQNDLNKIVSMTKELLEAEGISYGISEFRNAVSLLSAIGSGEIFEVLLLDVMMEELDGIELAAALRRKGNEAAVIFISSNRDMALLGYEVSAERYLAKPLSRDKLREALLYCCRTKFIQKEIILPTAEGRRRVSTSDILYAESWNRGTRLFLTDGECRSNVKISELGKMLPEEMFALCHRTLLVNLAFIRSIRYCELTLKNGQVLPVSKYRQMQIKEDFLRYLQG